MEHGSDGDTDYNLYGQNSPKCLVRRLEELEIRRQVETIQTRSLVRLARI